MKLQSKGVERHGGVQAPTNGNVVKDLLSLDDDDAPKASTAAPTTFAEDLLGGLGPDSNGHAAGPAPSSSAAIDLLSLLDDPASAQHPAAAAPHQNTLVHTPCFHSLRQELQLSRSYQCGTTIVCVGSEDLLLNVGAGRPSAGCLICCFMGDIPSPWSHFLRIM